MRLGAWLTKSSSAMPRSAKSSCGLFMPALSPDARVAAIALLPLSAR